MNIPPVISSLNEPGSSYHTIIGITTAICGNLVISIALNVQRYAHLRQQKTIHSCTCNHCSTVGEHDDSPSIQNIPPTHQLGNINHSRPEFNSCNTQNFSDTSDTLLEPHPIRPSLKTCQRSSSRNSVLSLCLSQSRTHSFTGFGPTGILANLETSPQYHHKSSSLLASPGYVNYGTGLTKTGVSSKPNSRAPSRKSSITTLLKVPILSAPYVINQLSLTPQTNSHSIHSTDHQQQQQQSLVVSSPGMIPITRVESESIIQSTSSSPCKSLDFPILAQGPTSPNSMKPQNFIRQPRSTPARQPHLRPSIRLNIPEVTPEMELGATQSTVYTSDHSCLSHDSDSDHDSLSEPNYLKSSLWWLGAGLMTVGEIGNFVAYGFAPASVVSPLGVLALVSNCIIAPIFFNEPIAKRNYTGVGISVLGILLIITSVNPSQSQFPSSIVLLNVVLRIIKELNPHDLILCAVSQLQFQIYLLVVLSLIIILLFGSNFQKIWNLVPSLAFRKGTPLISPLRTSQQPQYNSISQPDSISRPSSTTSSTAFSDLFSNLGLVALFGAFTALSTKCLSSIINFSITAAIEDPLTYTLLFILVSTAIFQVIFLNKALQRYNATVVIPVHFVFFTISVIIGSAITFHDFENSSPWQLVRFFTGCLLTFVGVWYVTGSGAEPVDTKPDTEVEYFRDGDNCLRPSASMQACEDSEQSRKVYTHIGNPPGQSTYAYGSKLDTIHSPTCENYEEGNMIDGPLFAPVLNIETVLSEPDGDQESNCESNDQPETLEPAPYFANFSFNN